jgi:hypothetical protein
MNRLAEGVGIVGTAEEYSLAARRLVERGYLPGDARRKRVGAGRKTSGARPRRRARSKR